MFGISGIFDSLYACHRFKVGVFDIVFFDFGTILISIARLDLTLKLLFNIVVIVTVLFLNLFFPFNVVLHWYRDSLYAC